ncbi:MAG: hypothetical protein ACOCYO_03260 [Bacteroidota bacterium]
MTEKINLTEWLGYLASSLILLSMMMSSIKKLRWINLTGAALFSIYGFIIGAMPVAFMNTLVVFINVYHLFQLYFGKKKNL